MIRLSLLIPVLFVSNIILGQGLYTTKMEDPSINFYEVCKTADQYFSTIDKFAKGSGYKGYQRWKYANEYKYYPSGIRNNVDPLFSSHAFQNFVNPTSTSKSVSFSNGWHELGPFRIDSISGHYSAGLGRVEDHYVDPIDTNVMYLGSRSGGFWKTSDGGISWQGGFTDTLMASGVNVIAVSPTNHDSILINIQNSSNQYSHGIYRSIDGGDNWVVTDFNPTNLGFGGLGSTFRIYTIAYHPTVANLVFVGTNKGVFKSTDNLQTWTSLFPISNITDIKFHPTNPNIIYLADTYYYNNVRNYVLRSLNQGVSYTQSAVILGNNNSSGRLSVSADCSNCVYFASTNGVWKSTDSGVNFSFLTNPSQSCFGFAVNDQDTSNMIYGYLDILASNDGGNTFNQVTWWSLGSSQHGTGDFQYKYDNSSAYVHADLHPAKCINGTYYVGTDGTFSKSTDNGVSWEILNQGTAIRENYKLGVSQSNHYRSVSGSQDNGTSIKLRDDWLEFYGADGMEGIIHPLNDDWIIGSVQNGTRRRTKNGGQTQTGITPPNNGSAAWEAPIAYDPNNQMRVYDFRDSVYVSEDFGSTWIYKGKPTSFTGTINQAAIAENNSNIILISKNQYIDKSTNGGASFSSTKNNLPNYSIQDIAFDPKDDNTIIVTYATYQNNNSKVYMSTNGGLSWSNITYNLGDMPIHSVVIDHSDSSNIYVGAEIGVYTKPKNGTSWTLYNPNLPNTTIQELEIVYGSNTLKAATWGRGMWEYDLVDRNSYPSIISTKISDQPTDNAPIFGMDQYVTSIVSYDNSLDSVFVKWSVNTLTFDSTLAMYNSMDSTWISQTPLPNYPIGTKMYFKVFAIGSANDTSETYKFMYTVRPFEYCAATGNSDAGNLYISNLQIANVNKTSFNNAYSFYTNSIVYLFIDSTYSISLSANTTWSSNDCGAWIDFNHNAVFDASENLGLPSFTGNTSQINFTVPSNANSTDTLRLRARLSYWNTFSEPCGNTLGEVEDYPVIITAIPTLDFLLSNTTICEGQELIVEYTGDVVDSVQWNFSNGSQTISGSGFSDSIVFNTSGSFDLNLVGYIHGFAFDLDSSNVISVHPVDLVNINLSTCNPLDSGIVIQNLTNAQGCDSIVTTNTQLLPSHSIYVTAGSCNPLDTGVVVQNFINMHGCDSILTTTTSLLLADSVVVDEVSCKAGQIGTDVQTFSNANGCDSVVTTITSVDVLNSFVSISANVLTAQPSGLSYQWLNCDSNFTILVGDTNQVFTATSNGMYAVEVSDGACVDTTECREVVGLNIQDLDMNRVITLYPNPTQDYVIIEMAIQIDVSEFTVFNILGEDLTSQILISRISELKLKLDFSKVAAGVYVIKTKSTSNKITKY